MRGTLMEESKKGGKERNKMMLPSRKIVLRLERWRRLRAFSRNKWMIKSEYIILNLKDILLLYMEGSN
jgi:hypothetical protein